MEPRKQLALLKGKIGNGSVRLPTTFVDTSGARRSHEDRSVIRVTRQQGETMLGKGVVLSPECSNSSSSSWRERRDSEFLRLSAFLLRPAIDDVTAEQQRTPVAP